MEINKLQKENHRLREECQELRADLEEAEDRLASGEAENNRLLQELEEARSVIDRFKATLERRVEEVRLEERRSMGSSVLHFEQVRAEKQRLAELTERLGRELAAKQGANQKLRNLLGELSRKHRFPLPTLEAGEEEFGKDTEARLEALTQKFNRQTQSYDNLLAENKVLRRLSGVPDNYGFDLEQVKLAEKQQGQDFRRRIRLLETEVQELEEERTQLRFKLRSLGTQSLPTDRYRDLSEEQLEVLDEVALRLKAGTFRKDRLRGVQELEEEVRRLRARNEDLEHRAGGVSQAALDSIRKGQEEIKIFLQKDKRRTRPEPQSRKLNSESQYSEEPPRQQPSSRIPEEHLGVEGPGPSSGQASALAGSYLEAPGPAAPKRQAAFDFAGPVQSASPEQLKRAVTKLMVDFAEQRRANAQLESIVEELTLRIEEYQSKSLNLAKRQELVLLRRKEQEQESRAKSQHLQHEAKRAVAALEESQARARSLEESLRAGTGKKQLVDCQVRLAQAEGKVQGLQRQLEGARAVLDEREREKKGRAEEERDHWLKEKYIRLRESYLKLVEQSKGLVLQLRQSVPGHVHHKTALEVSAAKSKLALAQQKEIELRGRICDIENAEHRLQLKHEELDLALQQNADLQLECAIVGKRLQFQDEVFRRYQHFLKRLAGEVRAKGADPGHLFDRLAAGKEQLGPAELLEGLKGVGILCSAQEVESYMLFSDLNHSGGVDVKEFTRKLRRNGSQVLGPGQATLLRVGRALREAEYTLGSAFLAIDSKAAGLVSEEQVHRFLEDLGQKVSRDEVNLMFKLAGREGRPLSLKDFEKVFQGVLGRAELRDEFLYKTELGWREKTLLQVSSRMKELRVEPTTLFEKFDSDHDRRISKGQFAQILRYLGVSASPAQGNELFSFGDRSNSGFLDYGRFLRLFQDVARQNKLIQKKRVVQERARELEGETKADPTSGALASAKAQSKSAVLELKLKNSVAKISFLAQQLARREEEVKQLEVQVSLKDQELVRISELYFGEKVRAKSLEEGLKGRLSEEESRSMRQARERLELELQDARSALELNRSLHNNVATLNRSLAAERDELKVQLRDYESLLKSSNVDSAAVNLQLRLAQKSEALRVLEGRKAGGQEELAFLRQQNARLMEKLERLDRLQQRIQGAARDEEKTEEQELVGAERVEGLLQRMRDVSEQKSRVELELRGQRQKTLELQLRNAYLELDKERVELLEAVLRRQNPGELGHEVIELSSKLSGLKLQELKARRECALAQEQQEHLLRLQQASKEHVEDIQQELADWEVKLQRREEFWRRKVATLTANAASAAKPQQELPNSQAKEALWAKQYQPSAEKLRRTLNLQHVLTHELRAGYSSPAHGQSTLHSRVQPISEDKQVQPSIQVSRVGRLEEQRGLDSRVDDRDEARGEARAPHKSRLRGVSPGAETRASRQLEESRMELTRLRERLREQEDEVERVRRKGLCYAEGIQTELDHSQLGRLQSRNQYLDSQREKLKEYAEQNVRISSAAQQSISLLQRLIDDKNEQLQRRDRQLASMRDEMSNERVRHSQQLQRMAQEVRALHGQMELRKEVPRPREEAARRERPESKVQKSLESDVKHWTQAGSKLKSQNQQLRGQLQDLRRQNDRLRKRVQGLQRSGEQIESLKKLLSSREKDIVSLNNTIQGIKKKLCYQAIQKKPEPPRDEARDKVLGKAPNDGSLELELQQAVKTIGELRRQNRELVAEVKRLKEQGQTIAPSKNTIKRR